MANLGADETKPSWPFVRWFYLTDIQEVSREMLRIIQAKYTWDWINPRVWDLIGFDADSKITPFLEALVFASRELKKSITPENFPALVASVLSATSIKSENINEYMEAYAKVLSAGLVPSTIQRPFTYTPETSSPLANLSKGLNVVPILLGAIAVYALVSVGVPNIVLGLPKAVSK